MVPLALLALAPGSFDAWKTTPIVVEGDVIPGVGAVTQVLDVAVNDARNTAVVVRTDHPNPEASDVLLVDGVVAWREGELLPAPAGAVLDGFLDVDLDDDGRVVMTVKVLTGPVPQLYAVYFDDTLVRTTGDSAAGVGNLTAGTVYRNFHYTHAAGSGRLLGYVEVDDPKIPTWFDPALIAWTFDADGQLVAEDAVATEDSFVAGLPALIDELAPFSRNAALDASGRTMFGVRVLPDPEAIVLDGALLTIEGAEEPSSGETWTSLLFSEVALNDAGGWALAGNLGPYPHDDVLLVANGQAFARTGDSVPGVPGATLEGLGTGPIHLSDEGALTWFASWSHGFNDLEALLRDDQVIARTLDTFVGPLVLIDIAGNENGYDASDDGRFVIYAGTLADGRTGAFLAGPAGSVQTGLGCGVFAGSLVPTAGSADAGDTLTLTIDGAQTNGAAALLALATQPVPGYPPCGLEVPGLGELLVDLTPPNPVLTWLDVWSGAPLDFELALPAEVFAVGLRVWAQGFFYAPTEPEVWRLTPGASIVVGDLHTP